MLEGTTENGAASGSEATAPVTSGNITSGTASEALIKAASAASSAETTPAGHAGDTQTQTGGDATPGATTGAKAQSGTEGQAGDAPANRGPIPFDRHETAVKNARAAGVQEAEAKFAWAKDIPAGAVQQIPVAMRILTDLQRDPKDFFQRLGTELGLTTAPQGDGKPTTSTQDTMPEPDLETQDGKVKAYSADSVRKIVDLSVKKALDDIRGEFKPFREFTETAQERAEQAAIQERTRTEASEVLTEMRARPYFKDNEVKIAEKLRAMPVALKQKIGATASLYRAYNEVLQETVFPTIDVSAEQRVRESNTRKAAASSGAHPVDSGNQGKAASLRDGDVAGLARHLEKLSETATV